MSISETIKERSAQRHLEALKKKGFLRVANPEAVAEKILKYTGVKVEIGENVVRLI